MTKLICNKKNKRYPRCVECPHGKEGHPVVGECDKVDTDCSPDPDSNLIIKTQCVK